MSRALSFLDWPELKIIQGLTGLRKDLPWQGLRGRRVVLTDIVFLRPGACMTRHVEAHRAGPRTGASHSRLHFVVLLLACRGHLMVVGISLVRSSTEWKLDTGTGL